MGSLLHISLANLATKHGPLMHLKLGQRSTIVISSPQLAKEMMKTHDLTFANRPQLSVAKIMFYNCQDIAFSRMIPITRNNIKALILDMLVAKSATSSTVLEWAMTLSIPRESTQQCHINGYIIPNKTIGIVNMWAPGRDLEYWEEAEKFEPERFNESPLDVSGNHFHSYHLELVEEFVQA
ncbi:hypothetical protein RDI58_019954 [Solanum bulbocastanum]|uniref:Uncharacterized protein n=1 Tax=Solanum bulbocastanum TaxID=147425 RepID=A0AAN8YA71_SOLBU